MKLTLIRHGITEGNLRKLYYGSTDIPLLPQSISELEMLGRSGGYPKGEKYYTSGMLRTEQTLAALYGDVPHETITDLREIDFGDFEMRSYEELRFDPAYIEWITGDNESNPIPNGESGVAVTKRALAAIKRIVADGMDSVCITHGGVIGGVLSELFPDSGGRFRYTPDPGKGFQIEFENGKAVSVVPVPEGKNDAERIRPDL